MSQRYRLPRRLILRVAYDVLRNRPRSLRPDALTALSTLEKPPLVTGLENLSTGPGLLALNHYSRPGLNVWWGALALSAALPGPLHWVMAGGWTYPDWLRRATLEPLTAWAFHRLAAVYGFTAMPPMPPRPHEQAARAVAVRRVVAWLRSHPEGFVALSPEGRDIPGGALGWPPPGTGRWIAHLAGLGAALWPVGMWEEEGRLCLAIGKSVTLDLCCGDKNELDRHVSRQVMQAIARLLPPEMRGEFSTPAPVEYNGRAASPAAPYRMQHEN